MSMKCLTTDCEAVLDPRADANRSGYCGICRRDRSRRKTAVHNRTTDMKGT